LVNANEMPDNGSGKVSALYNPEGMITLDSFAQDMNVSLIKIDVEGMEADVIQGAKGTIAKHLPALYIDHGEQGDDEKLAQTLQDIGYVAYWHVVPFFNPMNAFRNGHNIWQQAVAASNLIAVHESVEVPEACKSLQPYLGPGDTWKSAVDRMAKAHEMQRQAAE
jgi:hypothetical protein